MDRPSYAPDLPVRGENAPSATSGEWPAGALIAGAVAGPVLLISSFVQGLMRDGVEFATDPPSALALGSVGVGQDGPIAGGGRFQGLRGGGGWGAGVGARASPP